MESAWASLNLARLPVIEPIAITLTDSGRWGIPIRPTFAYVGSASSVIWDMGEEID
jgi:hypothetical protein